MWLAASTDWEQLAHSCRCSRAAGCSPSPDLSRKRSSRRALQEPTMSLHDYTHDKRARRRVTGVEVRSTGLSMYGSCSKPNRKAVRLGFRDQIWFRGLQPCPCTALKYSGIHGVKPSASEQSRLCRNRIPTRKLPRTVNASAFVDTNPTVEPISGLPVTLPKELFTGQAHGPHWGGSLTMGQKKQPARFSQSTDAKFA